MKFTRVRAYQRGDTQGLEALYDDKEGRHEIKAEGNNEQECLLNLLNMQKFLAITMEHPGIG